MANPDQRAVQELKPEEMAVFAAVANVLSPKGVGLHCSRCGQDFKAANSAQDSRFSVECGCREMKAENPHRIQLHFDRIITADEALS